MKVECLCTTDDPADDLASHEAYAKDRAEGDCLMLPTFRPDKAMALEDVAAWKAYIAQLSGVAQRDIRSYAGLSAALAERHAYFHERGCRLSDHGFEKAPGRPATAAEAELIFQKAFKGESASPAECQAFRSALAHEALALNAQSGWTAQIHLGAIRDLNSQAFKAGGPNLGYDAIGNLASGNDLAVFLDSLARESALPKTVLYTLNPGLNEVLACVANTFQDGSVAGKVQFGAAWWFNDHFDGMTKQLKDNADYGLLSLFVGMLTDSRSFLSFPRHEYFRRILCRLLGEWMREGFAPRDWELMGSMVESISYKNARDYFKFGA
jgi:glucuronate isomerase